MHRLDQCAGRQTLVIERQNTERRQEEFQRLIFLGKMLSAASHVGGLGRQVAGVRMR